MENGNRIGGVSITPTGVRQTPQNDFGTVFARTAQEVAKTGVGVMATMRPGNPAVNAAVSSIRTVASATTTVGGTSAAPTPGSVGGAAGGVGGTTGRGEQWDLMEAQRAMQAEGFRMNLAYMNLQNEMQKESRQHSALSNIMKVRHDTAKAAINNIR
jgi:hypothetical protein